MKKLFGAIGRTLWAPYANPRLANYAVAITAIVAAAIQLLFPLRSWAFELALFATIAIYLSRANPWLRALAGSVIVMAVWPLAGKSNTALTFLMIQVFINVALALGLNLVVGFAGLLDLGYVAFFAGGAYVYAIFASPQAGKFMDGTFPLGSWWFWVSIPVSIAVAAFLGIALGIPVLRLRGDYLAIVTLGFGEIINVLAKNLDAPVNITNGARGISSISYPQLFGLKLDNNTAFYFMGLVIVLITLMVVYKLERSRIGRAWAAMREDDVAARAMGVPLVRMKLLAFATGASFAGAMGVLYSIKQQFINPDSFTLIQSVEILAMVILGGLGSVPGTVIGAVALTVVKLLVLNDFGDVMGRFDLPPAFRLEQYQPMLFGLILILMMIYRQEGLIPARRPREDIDKLEAQRAAPGGRPAGVGTSVAP